MELPTASSFYNLFYMATVFDLKCLVKKSPF